MWEQIQSNRRRSAFVVAGLGVLLVVTGGALGAMFAGGQAGAMLIGGAVALGLWLILWVTSLSRGDDIMLQMAKARQIQKHDHPQLWNIVEEMTIASSLGKMPRVFIVDDPAPNAFAVGRDPSKATVAVTTGLLALMNRDELQGVIAHELGHIKNRDVALLTTAGIMIGAIVLLAEIGRRALWSGGARRSRSSDEQGGNGAVVIVAILLVIVTPILAQLLYFSLSRRREYMADASGALYTRYPDSLASALEKLGGSHVAQSDQSAVTAPMYIVRPLQGDGMRRLSAAFSTHPPLDRRIATLRAMGGAGLGDYEKAYRQVHGTNSRLIGSRSIAAAGDVAAAAPAAAAAAGNELPRERMRDASDAFLSASGYQRRECSSCGAIHKVPPALVSRLRACTRCKTPL